DRVRVHHSRLAVADAADRRRSGPCAPELGGSRRVRNQLSCPSLAAPPREGSRAIPRPPPGFLRVVCKPFRDGRGRIATRTARPYPARRRGVARKVRAAARMHRYCPGLAGFVGTVSPAIVAIALLAACGGGGGGNADGSEGPKVPPPAPQENAPFRAIAGISMGAYGALNLGTKHPDAFGVIGSLGGPVDLTQLLVDLERQGLAVKALTASPGNPEQEASFDHMPRYPGRNLTLSLVKDLMIAFGNPFLHHPDPSRQYLASDSEPAA